MSSTSPSSASHRRSLWASSSPFSDPLLSPQDTTPHRFFSLRSPRPSSSSSRSSIYETAPRPRTFSRGQRKSRDTIAPESSKRMSFIDFGDDPSSGLLGSLRERMQRKKSAPLLRSSLLAPPTVPSSSSWMFKSSPSQKMAHRSPLNFVQDDPETSPDVDLNPMLGFRDERKLTVMPEEIMGGRGYGIRKTRKASVTESDAGEDVDVSKAGYRALPLRGKDCMLLHSYPRSDAPYMQSYSNVALQNDLYFHLLLRRLNNTGSPSFREYLYPPKDVLDLGCGQGTWVHEAAAAWAEAGTKIVGYDLVDLVSDNAKPPPNATWKRGNFIRYSLPFKSGSFDLVRLSNLTEAVPQSRWEHVLIEVRRVLKSSGRVEIIDDETIFPYPELAPRAPGSRMSPDSGSHASLTSCSSNQSDETHEDQPSEGIESSFLDLDTTEDRRSVGSAPGLCRDDSPSEESSDCPPTPVGGLTTSLECVETTTPLGDQTLTAPLCREIENIYQTMLEGVYSIDYRPGDFLESLLWIVFGPAGKANTLKDFKLSLLNSSIHDLVIKTKHVDSTQDSPRRSKKFFKGDRDGKRFDKNKEILDKVAISQSKSKALRVLGADGPPPPPFDPIGTHVSEDSDLTEEPSITRPVVRPSTSSGVPVYAFPPSYRPSSSSSAVSQARSRQWPTGLFVSPDQFLETTPLELERYLYKHIDTLLSCKAALDEFVLSLRDESGDTLVQEDEWHDMLWEYECSRRERFNLPDAGGQFDDTDDEECDLANLLREPVRHPRPVIPAVAAVINNQSYTRQQSSDPSGTVHSSTLVRRIRVFEAFKIKPSLPP